MSVTWGGVLGVVEKLAPTIATGLGTPLLGGAVAALESVFGLTGSSASMDSRQAALATAISGATPEQLEAIRAKDQDYAIAMAKAGFDNTDKLAALAVQDRVSARNLQVSTKSYMPPILGGAIIAASIGAAAAILSGKVSYLNTTEATMVGTVVGYLFSEAKAVLSFYFGSSEGSARQTELLAQSTPSAGDAQ